MNQKGALYMAQAVNVNFKLDADVKKSMEQVCSELGLSMSAAFTIFAKKVGREKRIPFEVSVDPFYSESNIRYLESIVQDMKNGKAHFSEHDLIEVD
jgi:DNA-damage-inducible protein J